MFTLRPYQNDLADGILYHLLQQRLSHVLGVLPTGGGKTVVASYLLNMDWGPRLAMAHRRELVSQISLTLARFGLYHRIIAPSSTTSFIRAYHRAELEGACFINPDARLAVAGVDTLIRMDPQKDPFLMDVRFLFGDEGHHTLRGNKWGQAAGMFPKAQSVWLTATPDRADGKGLGAHADGIYEAMVEGPSQRDLINLGALTDYRIMGIPSDFDVQSLDVGTTGDYSINQMKKAAQASHIVGDVVTHFARFAKGKRGITFATDVETAGQMARDFQLSEIRAEAVSAKTPEHIRTELVRAFRNGAIDQLVNVDLFGEGFDLPAIEVVSMARPTDSFSLFAQQAGRMLRPDPNQPDKVGLLLDHVGNVNRHATLVEGPDGYRIELVWRNWTLDGREKGAKKGPSDAQSVTNCETCYWPYASYLKKCPHCGAVKEIRDRSGPKQVEGDLTELTPEVLAALRGDIDTRDRVEVYQAGIAAGMPEIGARGLANRHEERLDALKRLRDAQAHWAGVQNARGLSDADAYRKFYMTFNVDVLTAQQGKRAELEDMTAKIWKDLQS